MKPKLTPWFPAHTQPVRVGVYQRKAPSGVFYAYWTGKRWGTLAPSVHYAYQYRKEPSYHQKNTMPWRGIKQ